MSRRRTVMTMFVHSIQWQVLKQDQAYTDDVNVETPVSGPEPAEFHSINSGSHVATRCITLTNDSPSTATAPSRWFKPKSHQTMLIIYLALCSLPHLVFLFPCLSLAKVICRLAKVCQNWIFQNNSCEHMLHNQKPACVPSVKKQKCRI